MPDYETKGTEMMLNNKRQKKRWAKVGFIELGWILRSYTEWKKKGMNEQSKAYNDILHLTKSKQVSWSDYNELRK
jgi:hypothetical protein